MKIYCAWYNANIAKPINDRGQKMKRYYAWGCCATFVDDVEFESDSTEPEQLLREAERLLTYFYPEDISVCEYGQQHIAKNPKWIVKDGKF